MATIDYIEKPVKVFDKGIVDEIGAESIPAGTSSESINFLDLGDRIELVRGQQAKGTDTFSSNKLQGIFAVKDSSGAYHMYKKDGTKLKRYRSTTDDWNDVITGLPDEDLYGAPYRSPAGAFLWLSSKNSGLFRINLANPDDYVDFYDVSKNFKGWITVQDNRMWLLNDNATLYLSYIDDDWPYTPITSESLGTGDGATLTFTGTVGHPLVAGNTFSIVTGDGITVTDNGNGTLSSLTDASTGTINYTTGAVSVTFAVAPTMSATIVMNYSYEKPKTHGLADFTYTSPIRTAGQGSFLFQGQTDDALKSVWSYDGIFYVMHSNSIWAVDLTDDDTNATNKIYRQNTGISNALAAVSTGDGIYFIDDSANGQKALRLLAYNDLSGSKVLPISKSAQVHLDNSYFDDCAMYEFKDFIAFTSKSDADLTYNDTLWLYNKKWNLLNKMDGTFRGLVEMDGQLFGGSSVDNNVYEIFTGFDDDDSEILGVWEGNAWTLDLEELKKLKRFVVEGDIGESQSMGVDLSYDGGAFEEIGIIDGDGSYVDTSASQQYGTTGYGEGVYGSGETVTASRYMREFRTRSDKFYRVRVRFRALGIGYLNIRQYNFRDVRRSLSRVPSKFR